jgi:hypothetical protein
MSGCLCSSPNAEYLVRSVPVQTTLFKSSSDVNVAARLSSGFRDSAFTSNRAYPLHRWVPWIAGFSAEFVDDCLCKYLRGNQRNEVWVLDPFAGVGTTLVQSFLRGYTVVGFEINPYAALASRLKLKSLDVPVDAFAIRPWRATSNIVWFGFPGALRCHSEESD